MSGDYVYQRDGSLARDAGRGELEVRAEAGRARVLLTLDAGRRLIEASLAPGELDALIAQAQAVRRELGGRG